jgi:hypothetical protein
MILNPTHNIPLRGMPKEILDDYVRYKQGTRAIIAWLLKYTPSGYSQSKVSLRDLSNIVSSLVGKFKDLPDAIHFYFREVIASRNRMSKYFRSNVDNNQADDCTLSHEHFTDRLRVMYQDLCAGCTKKDTARTNSAEEVHSNESDNSPSSRFACLNVEELPDEDVPSLMEDTESDSQNLRRVPAADQSSISGSAFIDDDMAGIFELLAVAQDIHDVYVIVKEIWSGVRSGDVHFASAAFVTNMGHSELDRLEASLLTIDPEMDLIKLQRTCRPVLGAVSDTSDNVKSLGQGLNDLLKYLIARKPRHQDSSKLCGKTCAMCNIRANLAHLAEGAENPADQSHCLALATQTEDMLDIISDGTLPCSVVRNSSPVYADLGYIVTNEKAETHETRLALGLQLLTVSEINARGEKGMANRNYRLTSLRLAQQAQKSVQSIMSEKSCFPCACPYTLSWHLRSLNGDLADFLGYRSWSDYAQSGWVAGNHVLEILDLCNYYGTKLLDYRHFINSVVHCYNILSQLAGLEKFPILENLCQQYKTKFFPGGIPTRNFRASWTRCNGARLKFKGSHKGHNHKDSWCMEIPPHTARNAAGLGIRCNHNDRTERVGCPLFTIKQQGYSVTGTQWCELCSEKSKDYKECEHHTPATRMTTMLPEVSQLLTSTSGCALLDHFAVFRSCFRMISKISDEVHPDKKGSNCICFANAIIEAADRIVDARRLGKTDGACWTEWEREGVVKDVVDAMREEFGVRDVKEWVWRI